MFQLLVLPPVRGLKVHKELGRDRTWTADPDWPKGYSITYGVMLNNKTRGTGQGVGCCCSGTSSVVHQSAVVSNCFCLLFFVFLPFLCPYLYPLVLALYNILLIPLCAGEWMNGRWCLAAPAGLNLNNPPVITHGIFCPQEISMHLTGQNYTMHTHTT